MKIQGAKRTLGVALAAVLLAGCGSFPSGEPGGDGTSSVFEGGNGSGENGAVSGDGSLDGEQGRGERGGRGEDGVAVKEMRERGLVFSVDQRLQALGAQIEPYNYNLQGYPTASIYYYYRPVTDPLMDEAVRVQRESPELATAEYFENLYETIWAHSRCLLQMTLIPEEEYGRRLQEGASLDELSGWDHTEEFGRNDGYVYLASVPEFDTSELGEEEISQYMECRAAMEEVKAGLTFLPVELEKNDTELGTGVPAFVTRDLEGNVVTEEIFKGKDLTVVNVWGTFCVPCVEEMPELGRWAEELPDRVQLLGLVCDIEGEADETHRELAREITKRAGADFVQLEGNEDWKEFLDGIVGVPTTFFVDGEGNLVGEPVVGADVDGYRAFVEEYLHEME